MTQVTRDEYIPSWVGERGVSSDRYETVELLKALGLFAGHSVKIVEEITPGESDEEFRDRMANLSKFLEEAAYRKYPYRSECDDVQVYTGSSNEVIAKLNARLAIMIWRLYHRMLSAKSQPQNTGIEDNYTYVNIS